MFSLEALITKIFFILVVFDVYMGITQKSLKLKSSIDEEPQNTTQTEEDHDHKFENVENVQEEVIMEEPQFDGSTNTIPYFINIQYCNRSNLHNTYENLKRTIYMTYPRIRMDILGTEYPVPQNMKLLSQFFTYAPYVLMAVLFFYKQIFAALKVPVPQVVDQIADKKLVIFMMIFLFSGQLSNYFLQSNGFRVIVDDQVAYEVVGQPVDFQRVVDSIKMYIKE